MQFVLQSVETSRLEEAYNHFIGRVLKEEQSPEVRQEAVVEPQSLVESVVVTGDEQSAPTKTVASDKFSQLRKLAGMNS
jgi:hypothetical protein